MNKLIIGLGITWMILLNGCSSPKNPLLVKGSPEYKAELEKYAKTNARHYREAAGNFTGYPVGSAEYKKRMTPEYIASRKKRDAKNKALEEARLQTHAKAVASRQQANAKADSSKRTVTKSQQNINKNFATDNWYTRSANPNTRSYDINELSQNTFNPNTKKSSTYLINRSGNLYNVQKLGDDNIQF